MSLRQPIICGIWLFADEAQEAEAIQVLNAIFDMREHQSAAPPVMAKIAYACAMLYFVLHDDRKVGQKWKKNET